MKSIIRFVCLLLILSGWIVAGLCLHVVRTPDPDNPQQSKLLIVPKNRLGINDTYVDARGWTMQDATDHPMVILRLLEAGKADELKYLTDPKSKKDVATQLTDALSNTSGATTVKSPATAPISSRPAGFSR
ncbi:MAG: hypothetical protein ABSH08_18480 [Tepidisphaeraceae bacterium]